MWWQVNWFQVTKGAFLGDILVTIRVRRHAAPLATKPGKALDSKTTLLAYSAFRATWKIAFPPVMSVFHC